MNGVQLDGGSWLWVLRLGKRAQGHLSNSNCIDMDAQAGWIVREP